MPLRIVRQPHTTNFWLSGTVLGQRVRESTGTDKPALAEERRAAREAQIYRARVHGLKTSRTFAEVALSYLKRNRSDDTKRRLNRVLRYLQTAHLDTIACDQVNQELLDQACEALLRPGAADSTRLREVVSPVKAVLRHGAIRGWCAIPLFETLRQGKRRKNWLTPGEAEAIIAASPPHLAPLFTFIFCTGARRGEALGLDWQSVQLRYGRVTLRNVKSRPEDTKDRQLDLCPRAHAALAGRDNTSGPVFRRADGSPWHANPAISGAQVNTAFQAIARQVGITRHVSLHVMRHSWASWHYALHQNLKKLAQDGAWDSIAMADRYSHLVPAGMVPEILAFWGLKTAPAAAEGRNTGGPYPEPAMT